MMKKKRMTWLLAVFAGLLATSCSNEVPVPGTESNDVITFTVNPDPGVKTRATSSIVPAGKKLRYIMEVYDVAGNTMTLNSRTVQAVADETTPATFTWQRPQGSTYKAVFWADLTLQASEEADAYYDTSSGLDNVTFVSSNTDNFDGEAFFGSVDISSETSATESVTLTHAVSLVNLKTTQPLTGYGSVKVTYGEAGNTNAPVSSFNAVNGTAGATGATVEKVNTVNPSETATPSSPYDFHSFYLFAPTDTKGLINMKVEMCSDAAGATPQQTANIPNVPLRANYKTNVTGDFAQATDAFSISCGDGWSGGLSTPSIWNGTVPTGNSSGSAFSGGTGANADNAYLISSAADLAQLAADVNAGCEYDKNFFELTVDVDLKNKDWTPIGLYSDNSNKKPFKGYFNGNHHQISNLKIDRGDMACVGLFGNLDALYAKVERLHVQGNVKNSFSGTADRIGAAGIVGYLNSDAHIMHCSFSGTVQCPNGEAGGLAGTHEGNSSFVIASKNTGTISGKCSGGIIGGTGAAISCYNTGAINGTERAGGICSEVFNPGADMAGCYNIGTVTCSTVYVGALRGNDEDYRSTGDCFVLQSYNKVDQHEKVFSNTDWPNGSNVGDEWYANESNDGTFTFTTDPWGREEITGGRKFWKSIGSYDAVNPVYPKLWWEE